MGIPVKNKLNPSTLRKLTHEDFEPPHQMTMMRSMCIPDMIQSYSLCIEFIKEWFLNKFRKDLFQTVYLEGKHIFDDFRSISKRDLLKRPKPAVSITPSIDLSFNNDNLDVMMFGLDVYNPQGNFRDSFFNDNIKNLHLGIGMQLLSMSFSFRLKFATRAQQLNLFQYMKYAFRMGSSFGVDVDMDFHIPYTLIAQIARDAGFEVRETDNEDYPMIVNMQKFISYLNRHSSLPFLYKLRTINGHHEFFLRIQRMYIRLQSQDISADDGNRVGHLMDDFNIEYSVEVKFPAPKYYAYYSENYHNLKKLYTVWNASSYNITTIYAFTEVHLPEENQVGWPVLMTTTYEEENISDKLEIDFSEVFEGDLKECINSCILKSISPSIFIDIMILNGREILDGTIDWRSMKFTSSNNPRGKNSFIAIYIDNAFVDNYLLEKRNAYDTRINQSTNNPKDIIEAAKKESYIGYNS